MLPEIETIIYNSEKVDALTLTSKSVFGRAMVQALYTMFSDVHDDLAFQKKWSSLGYQGYSCGGVRWGSRLDGSVLFSSGDDAMTVTGLLLDEFDYMELKTTRVDVCIDVALGTSKRGWLRSLRESEEFQGYHNPTKRKTTVIEGDTGDTLYIGSRHSGRYGRIYDKSSHYGVDLGLVYRFELETKKQVAPALFKRLFPEGENSEHSWDVFPSRCRSVIQSQFSKWGVAIDLGAGDNEQIKAECRISTVDSSLQWLSRTVAPMVQKLSKAGYRQQAFEALGIDLPVSLVEK